MSREVTSRSGPEAGGLPPGDPRARHGRGRHEGEAPGPTVIVVGGMHGNEPGGLAAMDRLTDRIDRGELKLRGRLVMLTGNVEACARGVRLIDEDMNRLWTRTRIDRLRSISLDACASAEEREVWSLSRELDRALDEATWTPLPVVIDLHTASAPSVPFAVARNTLDHAALFRGLPIPIIAGLEEALGGLLLGHAFDRGARTLAIETGPHESETAAEDLESVVLWILIRSGLITGGELSSVRDSFASLRERCAGIPPIVEVIHRHPVVDRERFVMEDGFRSFDRVAAQQVLAVDHGLPVRAPCRSRLLMPLYQDQGEDGFFIGLERDRPYLWLSEWFRRLRLQWLLGFFPSVRREPGGGDVWRVDRPDHRWVREALRFFGYREQVELKSGTLLASRSRP